MHIIHIYIYNTYIYILYIHKCMYILYILYMYIYVMLRNPDYSFVMTSIPSTDLEYSYYDNRNSISQSDKFLAIYRY